MDVETPDLRDAFSAGWRRDSVTAEQEDVLAWFFGAKLRADENRFREVQLNIVDESTFRQLGSNSAYGLPYLDEWWATNA